MASLFHLKSWPAQWVDSHLVCTIHISLKPAFWTRDKSILIGLRCIWFFVTSAFVSRVLSTKITKSSYTAVLRKNAVWAFICCQVSSDKNRIYWANREYNFPKISDNVVRNSIWNIWNFNAKYAWMLSKIHILSWEIRQLSNVHTAFVLGTAV